ncbi:hypothetical protein [Pseudonocardia sp. TRM90224]|uniref:hypothetical protein n=1 Tax=Pseudonocardia sp. TRM90224 TaxID=2812678 RepID=UPI001E2B3C39|nr:hypothetical protein [Pseudonocardia sp. TRM90224]
MSEAVGSLLEYLRQSDKGQLHTVSLVRDGEADWIDCSFSLDSRPGVEFTFRSPISAATGEEPQTGPHLAVSIFLMSIEERTQSLHRARTVAVDGKISLD